MQDLNYYNIQKNKKSIFTDINKNINISFEFFPSSNNIIFKNLLNTVQKLSIFNPKFFSVTYGANSGEFLLTKDTVIAIKKLTKITTIPHLTCIGLSFDKIKTLAENYWNLGIKNILALRGDIPKEYSKNNIYAINLVSWLRKIADFNIFVAAYPEVHPEAKSAKFDLINLKNKIEAGASGAITQFFFDPFKYLSFRDRCIRFGIKKKIIPGILPIFNLHQLKRFAKLTNVHIPNYISNIYTGLDYDSDTRSMLGCSIALNMIEILYYEGVRDFHFYTLNKLDIVYSICCLLNSKINSHIF